MTREEAMAYFKKNAIRIKEIMAEEDEALKDRFSQSLEATEMAIKALEQEPILDKIRAEIKQYQSDYDVHGTEYDRTAWKAFNRCLQIIDKYKAESEGKK